MIPVFPVGIFVIPGVPVHHESKVLFFAAAYSALKLAGALLICPHKPGAKAEGG